MFEGVEFTQTIRHYVKINFIKFIPKNFDPDWDLPSLLSSVLKIDCIYRGVLLVMTAALSVYYRRLDLFEKRIH